MAKAKPAANPQAEKVRAYLKEFKIGSRTVDLTGAFPLVMKDYRALGRANVNIQQIVDKDGNVIAERLFIVVKHLIQKVVPDVKDDEIDDNLTMAAMLPVMQGIMLLEEGGLPSDDDPT